jgi:hypothetical protein
MRIRRFTLLLVPVLICGSAMAGDLKCLVTQAGTPVAGALVTLDPGGATARTNADGVCELTGLRAGEYQVRASAMIGGTLHGAIQDGVRMPERGAESVELAMTRAILIHEYMPLTPGSVWQYGVSHTEGRTTTTWTRRERVDGTTRVGREEVTVVEVTSVPPGDEMKLLATSTDKGYARYGEEQATDTLMFDPALRIGDLCPVGHEWTMESTVSHTDGTPDVRLTLRCKIAGFDRVTVPAGTFADCARLECFFDFGGRTDKQTMWLAVGVGEVRVVEKDAERRCERVLEEYRIARGLPGVRPVPPPAP